MWAEKEVAAGEASKDWSQRRELGVVTSWRQEGQKKILILEKAVGAGWGGICWQGPWGRWGWGDDGDGCDSIV